MTKNEALELALLALEDFSITDKLAFKASKAIKKALAQPEQRPWVGLTKEDMPSGEDPMFDHLYFIAGMVYADKVLKKKNT